MPGRLREPLGRWLRASPPRAADDRPRRPETSPTARRAVGRRRERRRLDMAAPQHQPTARPDQRQAQLDGDRRRREGAGESPGQRHRGRLRARDPPIGPWTTSQVRPSVATVSRRNSHFRSRDSSSVVAIPVSTASGNSRRTSTRPDVDHRSRGRGGRRARVRVSASSTWSAQASSGSVTDVTETGAASSSRAVLPQRFRVFHVLHSGALGGVSRFTLPARGRCFTFYTSESEAPSGAGTTTTWRFGSAPSLSVPRPRTP